MMNRGLPVLLLVLLPACLGAVPDVALGATLTNEEKQDLFSQAKELFRRANQAAADDPQQAKELYGKAAMRFQRLVRDGEIRNGKLYYNIGNTFFRMGDLGRAILNYRRAEQYIPGDPNLFQNLEYARSRRRDQIQQRQRTKVLKTILFWHYDLSPATRSTIFACCFVSFWLGASARILRTRAAPRWILVCLGVIAALFLLSLVADSLTYAHSKPGVIVVDEVVARKGDGLSYQPTFKKPLHAGTEFTMVEARNGWFQIELPDGRRCWLPQQAVELVR